MGKLPMYISKLVVLNPCQRVGPGPVRKYSSLHLAQEPHGCRFVEPSMA